MTTPNYEELKREFTSPTFRAMIKNTLGTSCYNCGSSESVEYHHVVPLKLGGTNRLSNIVPLCHKCHKAAHNGQHITHYADYSNATGRPPKVPDEEAFKAYDLLVDGQIGNKKLKQMLNLRNSTHPNATAQYKRYLAARGIKSIRSNFDVGLTLSCETFVDGRVIGYVVYESGEKKDIIFHDTGLNDDVEYEFCYVHGGCGKEKCTWGEWKDRIHGRAEEFSELSKQFFEETRADDADIVAECDCPLSEPCPEESADTAGASIEQEEPDITADTADCQEESEPVWPTLSEQEERLFEGVEETESAEDTASSECAECEDHAKSESSTETVEPEAHTEPTKPVEPIRNTVITEEERERDAIWWREYRKKLLRVV